MTKNISNNLVVNPNVTAEVGVRNEDLVAVAVARRERGLQHALNEAMREVKALGEKMSSAEARHDESVKAAVEAHIGRKAAALEAAMKKLGSAYAVQVTTADGRYEQKVGGPKTWRPLIATVQMKVKRNDDRHAYPVVSVSTHQVNDTEALLAVSEEIFEISIQKVEMMERIHAIKEALRNIGTTERQARAALAEATLRGTETGRELLDAMSGLPGLMEVREIGMVLTSEVE